MKRLLLSLITCLVTGLPLIAQPAAHPSTFRIISACGSQGGLLYDIGSGARKTTLSVSLNQTLSAPMLCPAGGHVEIYRLIPPPSDAPAGTPPARQVVVDARLPANQSDSIIVTFPGSANRLDPLQAHVVPASPDSHRASTLQIINFSSYTAGVGIDERQSTLAPGGVDVIKAGTGRVLLQVAVQKNNGWTKAFRGERRIAPQLRGYVFIFNYMVDPDYGPDPIPPPALVKTFFEVSPETLDVADKNIPSKP